VQILAKALVEFEHLASLEALAVEEEEVVSIIYEFRKLDQ
jgi:hypothetical protein